MSWCIILAPYLSSLKVVTYLKSSSLNEKTRRVQNLGQNVCGRFHVLVQFLFTTSETELDFINRKWMCEVPHEFPNNLRLKNLGNLITSTQPTILKPNFDAYGKISQKISSKTFHRKIYFAYFRQFFHNSLFKIVTCEEMTWLISQKMNFLHIAIQGII